MNVLDRTPLRFIPRNLICWINNVNNVAVHWINWLFQYEVDRVSSSSSRKTGRFNFNHLLKWISSHFKRLLIRVPWSKKKLTKLEKCQSLQRNYKQSAFDCTWTWKCYSKWMQFMTHIIFSWLLSSNSNFVSVFKSLFYRWNTLGKPLSKDRFFHPESKLN